MTMPPTTPRLRLLADQELVNPRARRRIDLTEYQALLDGVPLGRWAELMLQPTETTWTVKRRLRAVAAERGLAIRFSSSSAERLRFRMLTTEQAGVSPGNVPQEGPL